MTFARAWVALVAALLLALVGWPADAQAPKQGGVLNLRLREDLPYGFSIHESPTISTLWPAMPCFSNLVLFDPAKRTHSGDAVVGALPSAGRGRTTIARSSSFSAPA